jgi:hypothetical protein
MGEIKQYFIVCSKKIESHPLRTRVKALDH